jgi:hypothetical protein
MAAERIEQGRRGWGRTVGMAVTDVTRVKCASPSTKGTPETTAPTRENEGKASNGRKEDDKVKAHTSVTEIRGPSGPTKHSGFTPLKGVMSRRNLALSRRSVMTPCCLTILFPEKEIHDWVAHLVQSSTAIQRAQGEISCVSWGQNDAPIGRHSQGCQDS